jgi:hypothetical protein
MTPPRKSKPARATEDAPQAIGLAFERSVWRRHDAGEETRAPDHGTAKVRFGLRPNHLFFTA